MTEKTEPSGITLLNEDALERTTGGALGRPGGLNFSFGDGSVRATGAADGNARSGTAMDLSSLNIQRGR